MTLPRLDKIDRFGHCCICTKNLLTQRVVDGKVQDMFVPDYGESTFLLNDGSKMQVTICKTCQRDNELTNPDVQRDIMDAVQKGWQLEVGKLSTEGTTLPNGNYIRWGKDYSEKFLNFMSKKDIDIHVGDIDNNILMERSKKLSGEFRAMLENDKVIKDSEEVTILEVSK